MDKAKLEVRPISSGDLAPVFLLWKKLMKEEGETFDNPSLVYPQLDPDSIEVAKGWAAQYIRLLSSPGGFGLIALYAGVPIAYVLGCSGSRPLGKPERYALITDMYTEPKYRAWRYMMKEIRGRCDFWAQDSGADYIEVTCAGSPIQIDRWIRKGFRPYLIYLRRKLRKEK